MSMIPMKKKCPNCKKQFNYNPSVGNLGMICPHCHKPIIVSIVTECQTSVKTKQKLLDKDTYQQ